MTAQTVPKQLKIKEKSISFPYINHDIDDEDEHPLTSILVDIDEENVNTESVSLKYAFAVFYPRYGQYLRKHRKHPFYQKICDYSVRVIELPITYQYRVGQFGYITNGNTLERSFVLLISISEYETEIFFLHNELQKYEIEHYDIKSPTPKLLPEEELEGKSEGWITEAIFTPVPGQIIATTENEKLLNWKICREDYLIKKMNILTAELTQQIENRGILFRETVDQYLHPIRKALRGKITSNNIGKLIEVSFVPPKHIWNYYLEPTFVDIKQFDDADDFDIDGNTLHLDVDMVEAAPIIPFLYTVKLYDQNANAFKLNSQIDVKIESGDDIDDLLETLKNNMNKYSVERYKKLKEQNKENQLLRKVKFAITINGISWQYNINSGKTKIQTNVYKTEYLSNGQQFDIGKIDFP